MDRAKQTRRRALGNSKVTGSFAIPSNQYHHEYVHLYKGSFHSLQFSLRSV